MVIYEAESKHIFIFTYKLQVGLKKKYSRP